MSNDVTFSRPCPSIASHWQALELAARLNRKELFYHIIFKNREVCWSYGSRVNYNLDLRVVDGAPMGEKYFGVEHFGPVEYTTMPHQHCEKQIPIGCSKCGRDSTSAPSRPLRPPFI